MCVSVCVGGGGMGVQDFCRMSWQWYTRHRYFIWMLDRLFHPTVIIMYHLFWKAEKGKGFSDFNESQELVVENRITLQQAKCCD